MPLTRAPFARMAMARHAVVSRSSFAARAGAFPRATGDASAGARRFASGFEGPGTKSKMTPEKMRTNILIAAALFAASGAYYFYESRYLGVLGDKDEFSVTVGSGSRAQTFAFDRKKQAEVEVMLHEHEVSTVPARERNPVVRWDINFIPSNEPCEDRFAADIIPRSGKDGSEDLVLFSVLDGHAGSATSELLSHTLHPAIGLGLAGLKAGLVPEQSWYWRLLNTVSLSKAWTPTNVAKTLQATFVKVDNEINDAPLKALPGMLEDRSPEKIAEFVRIAAPAVSGAVVGTALVDVENAGLYVAVTGDCRAVAGWHGPSGWRSDTLSEDQMGDNPKEVARMRSEHPSSEADTVIRNGRVQGGLQPTRAFGDSVYKWTTKQGDAINALMKEGDGKARGIRPWNFTPPYVTAKPEVEYRPLTSASGEKLKFVVLATDGLWDRITSEESTMLVAGYLEARKRDDVAKATLAKQLDVKPTEPRPYPVQALPGSGKREDGQWVFEDDANAATHLIRNALGGGDRKYRGELLSLHGKVARYFRDDMTVTVIFFDNE